MTTSARAAPPRPYALSCARDVKFCLCVVQILFAPLNILSVWRQDPPESQSCCDWLLFSKPRPVTSSLTDSCLLLTPVRGSRGVGACSLTCANPTSLTRVTYSHQQTSVWLSI